MFEAIFTDAIAALQQRFPDLPKTGTPDQVARFVTKPAQPHFRYGDYFIGKKPASQWLHQETVDPYSTQAAPVTWALLHKIQAILRGKKVGLATATASVLRHYGPIKQYLNFLISGDVEQSWLSDIVPHVIDDTSQSLALILLNTLEKIATVFRDNTDDAQHVVKVINQVLPKDNEICHNTIAYYFTSVSSALKSRIKKYQEHLEMEKLCRSSVTLIPEKEQFIQWRDAQITALRLKQTSLKTISNYYAPANICLMSSQNYARIDVTAALEKLQNWLTDYDKMTATLESVGYDELASQRAQLQQDTSIPEVLAYYVSNGDGEPTSVKEPIKPHVLTLLDNLLLGSHPKTILTSTHQAVVTRCRELALLQQIREHIKQTQHAVKIIDDRRYQFLIVEDLPKALLFDSQNIAVTMLDETQLATTLAMLERHIAEVSTSAQALDTILAPSDFASCSSKAQAYFTQLKQLHISYCTQFSAAITRIADAYRNQLTLKQQAATLAGLQQLSQAEATRIIELTTQQDSIKAQLQQLTPQLQRHTTELASLATTATALTQLQHSITQEQLRKEVLAAQIETLTTQLRSLMREKSRYLPATFTQEALTEIPGLWDELSQRQLIRYKPQQLLARTVDQVKFKSNYRRAVIIEIQAAIANCTELYGACCGSWERNFRLHAKMDTAYQQTLTTLEQSKQRLTIQQTQLTADLAINEQTMQQAQAKQADYDQQIQALTPPAAIAPIASVSPEPTLAPTPPPVVAAPPTPLDERKVKRRQLFTEYFGEPQQETKLSGGKVGEYWQKRSTKYYTWDKIRLALGFDSDIKLRERFLDKTLQQKLRAFITSGNIDELQRACRSACTFFGKSRRKHEDTLEYLLDQICQEAANYATGLNSTS